MFIVYKCLPWNFRILFSVLFEASPGPLGYPGELLKALEISEITANSSPRAPLGVLGSPGMMFKVFELFTTWLFDPRAPKGTLGTLGARWPARIGRRNLTAAELMELTSKISKCDTAGCVQTVKNTDECKEIYDIQYLHKSLSTGYCEGNLGHFHESQSVGYCKCSRDDDIQHFHALQSIGYCKCSRDDDPQHFHALQSIG